VLSADEEARRLAFVRERALHDEVSFLNEAKQEGDHAGIGAMLRKQISCALVLAGMSLGAYGVDTAPRISDREIIESLARLEAGQKALAEQTDQRFQAMEDEKLAGVLRSFSML
jgi:hypothetical protein